MNAHVIHQTGHFHAASRGQFGDQTCAQNVPIKPENLILPELMSADPATGDR